MKKNLKRVAMEMKVLDKLNKISTSLEICTVNSICLEIVKIVKISANFYI
jgi:hypothetical protein